MSSSPTTTKITCKLCQQDKTEGEFHRNRNKRNGRSSYCRACMARYHRVLVHAPEPEDTLNAICNSVDRACTRWLKDHGLYSSRGFGLSSREVMPSSQEATP